MFDLNEFVTFAAIVEAGSFSRAAEKLDVSKALVSKHVADLEHTLGVKLLNRTTRKLGLTPAGAIFYERCQQLVSHVDLARHELEHFRSTPGGLIKVSASIAFGRLHLVPAISRFLASHPDISVELELSEKFADLISGDADVIVRQAEEPRLMSLVARKLAPLRQIVCASPSYLARHAAPLRPEDLASHNCLIRTANLRNEWIFHDKDGARHAVRVQGNFKANNADGVLGATLQSLGIGAIPSMVAAEYVRSGKLVRLLSGYNLPPLVLYAAYLPNPTQPQCVQTFVSFLGAEFGDSPYWDKGLSFV